MTQVYDGGDVDWGKTSRDYATWRPNYPAKFYTLLATLGVDLPGQHILDLGTGIGFLALTFAEAGALVTGVDIAEGQIEEARHRARQIGSDAQFLVAPAEETGLADASFDVITASQSWIYFDMTKIVPEVKRLLKPGGLLMTSHFYWLPQVDAIARASEELVLKHNPKWSHSNLRGDVPVMPSWAEQHFRLHGMFVFDELILFTREAWRGRFRACRPIGAALTAQQVEAFDREHDALLRTIAPEEFSVLHRIDAHVLKSRTYG
jgi:SAM-dependent methyltransferase